ncbi:hypothetical protein [Fimbriimonas ginsengisoli]|uniref:Uncharacterized protein n=1 Tax=Fimbriimonas ginsengisoli Gsoil 348 TaxID=661478 RepID=A0A068NSC0_FIMGI|nr:hypothetical protein [Fimbriimonas ginsengisoli]AIE86443.1 hypothetical protein OP10G_3075 [Fimbriimonas ginsengisoli Gsoil 348]
MSDRNPPAGTQVTTVDNIDDRLAIAVKKSHQFRSSQKNKKLRVGVIGGGLALLGTLAPHAPSTPVKSSGPAPASVAAGFPEFIEDGACGLEGKSKKRPLTALDLAKNPLKNRTTSPAPSDIDPGVSLADFFGPDALEKSPKLNESKGVTITGYIVEIKSGGPETCNCQTDDTEFWDTHVYVAKNPTDEPKDAIVVEVTPRMRQILKPGSNEWDTKALKANFRPGTKVQITGWQFFDTEHWINTANNPKATNVWRASCWEVHPVTDIKLLAPPDAASAKRNSAPRPNEESPP